MQGGVDDDHVFIVNEKQTVSKNGIVLTLEAFSHKRHRPGGSTMATAHLLIDTGDGAKKPLRLSSHGEDVTPRPPPRLDHIMLEHLDVKLTKFVYGQTVTVEIKKLGEFKKVVVGEPFCFRDGEFIEWEQGFPNAPTLKMAFKSMGEENKVKFVKFVVFDAVPPESGHCARLFENGLCISKGTWVGEPGVGYSGFLIQLKSWEPLTLSIKKM